MTPSRGREDLVVDEISALDFAKKLAQSAGSEAMIVLDVRSPAEWTFVGRPDPVLLSEQGCDVIFVPWQTYPGMIANPNFLNQVSDELSRRGLGDDTDLYVLCRSGARSRAAAERIAEAGLARPVNITDGFEGDVCPKARRRGLLAGWKVAGLPWVQA